MKIWTEVVSPGVREVKADGIYVGTIARVDGGWAQVRDDDTATVYPTFRLAAEARAAEALDGI